MCTHTVASSHQAIAEYQNRSRWVRLGFVDINDIVHAGIDPYKIGRYPAKENACMQVYWSSHNPNCEIHKLSCCIRASWMKTQSTRSEQIQHAARWLAECQHSSEQRKDRQTHATALSLSSPQTLWQTVHPPCRVCLAAHLSHWAFASGGHVVNNCIDSLCEFHTSTLACVAIKPSMITETDLVLGLFKLLL